MRLTFSRPEMVATESTRNLSGRIVPYDEIGRTSAGLVQIVPGAFGNLPERVILNSEHDRTRPLGFGTVVARADGLYGSFTLADTTAARDALAEAAAGLRTGLSIEAELLEYSADIVEGVDVLTVTAAALEAVAHVVSPAYDSARLAATDTETGSGSRPPKNDTAPADSEETETVNTDPKSPTSEDETVNDETVTPDSEETETVNIETGRPAPAAGPGLAAAAPVEDAPKRLAAAYREGGTEMLTAALTDIVQTDTKTAAPAGWLGEVWAAADQGRQIVPMVGSGPLDSYTLSGWQFVSGKVPAGDTYLGDKGEVPTGDVETEAVTWTASRWAGAHDIDRALLDFQRDNAGFWEAYLRHMTRSYAAWTDALALTGLTTAATVATNAADPFTALDNAVSTAETGGAVAKHLRCLIASDVYATYAAQSAANVSAMLPGSVEGLGGQTVNYYGIPGIRVRGLAAKSVVVFDATAVTFRELSGTPLRADVPNIALGGLDVGLYGYAMLQASNPLAIASVKVQAP